jgi:hypothetical protein
MQILYLARLLGRKTIKITKTLSMKRIIKFLPKEVEMEIVTTLLAVIATAIAAWAAWEARKAAKATQAAVEAQVVYSAMGEYFEPKMAQSLRTLRDWQNKNGSDFANFWVQEFQQHRPEAVEVDPAKRYVKGFFTRVTRLYSAGLINERALRAVTYVNGINLFYDVIVPLDLAQNPDVDRAAEQILSRLIGRYQKGQPKV